MAESSNAKPAAPAGGDTDKWAEAQFAALEARTAPAAKPVAPATPRPRTIRPAHLIMAAAVGVAPALCLAVFLTFNAGAPKVALSEVQLSLDRLEKKMVALQLAEKATPPRATPTGEGAESYLALLSKANLLFRDQNYLPAMDLYRSAIAADTGQLLSDEAHYRLGVCLLKDGRPQEALDEWRLVVSRFPGSACYARASVEAAQVLMAQHQFASARRLLYQVIAVRDRLKGEERECLDTAYYAIARCYEGEADVAAAGRPSTAMVFDLKMAPAEVKR